MATRFSFRSVALISALFVLATQFGFPGSRKLGFQDEASAQIPTPGAELISRSTYANTFSLAEGKKQTLISTEPINFQDSSGAWIPIDNTLVPTADGGYTNLANEFDVTFGQTGAAAQLVKVEFEGKTLSFGLEGAADVLPVVEGSDITYPEILLRTLA